MMLGKDMWKDAYIHYEYSMDPFTFDNIIQFVQEEADLQKYVLCVESGLFSAVVPISRHFETLQWSLKHAGHLSNAMLSHTQRTMGSCVSTQDAASREDTILVHNICNHTPAVIVLSEPALILYLRGGTHAHLVLPEERSLETEISGIEPDSLSYFELQPDKTYVCNGIDCSAVESDDVFLE